MSEPQAPASADQVEEATADAVASEPTPEEAVEAEAVAVEADLDQARMAQERDEYLDALRRLQADFENYKKRVIRQQTEHLERAASTLVEKLLPVLDGFDLALDHGVEGIDALHRSLLQVLEAEGLERLDPVGKPFDPNEHEAVAHEPGEGDEDQPVVCDLFRAGYRWKGRVLRPAAVKVRG